MHGLAADHDRGLVTRSRVTVRDRDLRRRYRRRVDDLDLERLGLASDRFARAGRGAGGRRDHNGITDQPDDRMDRYRERDAGVRALHLW